ncbi:MAG: ATP-binding protein [Pseudomonadota bacterium]
MTQEELIRLLSELRALPSESEWVEFKFNYVEPEEIGEYLSAFANSASLHKKEAAYLIWGIEDTTHRVIGTDFKPRRYKVGNQELESWLALQLHPRIDSKSMDLCIWIRKTKFGPATRTPVCDMFRMIR